MKKDPVSRDELNTALDNKLEEHSKAIIKAIDTVKTDITNTLLDRIDKLENTYALDTRVARLERKAGIKVGS